MSPTHKAPLGFATRSVHGDTGFSSGREVAPNISLTTTFRQPTPAEILAIGTGDVDPYDGQRDIYSRYTQPTLTRVEKVLTAIIGQPTILYPSGLAATYAALLHYRPDTIAVTDGYHGCHDSFKVYQDTRGKDVNGKDYVTIIKLDDAYPTTGTTLCWVETPLNPTGECRSIEFYARKVHALTGGILAVDSTFGPPPLQDPFAWGADAVMHSATKYFGGHSDALTGTLSVKTKDEWMKLWHNRTYTGATPGGLESWLILRSLRTLNLRVVRQSKTASALAQWLQSLTRAAPESDLDGPAGLVDHVWHATLQDGGGKWVGEGKQMTGGSACFGIMMTKPYYAAEIGHILELFTPATSLGGVESLIEQRFISDPGSDPRLVRISVGLEDFEDLKADMIQAFRKLLSNERALTGKI